MLSLHRLAVRGAQAISVGGAALQVWTVLPEFGTAADIGAVREDVRRALDGRLDVTDRLRRRDEAYPDRTGRTAPPARVDLVAGASDTSTVLEVRAHDRPALLHRIGTALADGGVDVRSARVSTLGSEAVDVFYVVGADGGPLPPPASAGPHRGRPSSASLTARRPRRSPRGRHRRVKRQGAAAAVSCWVPESRDLAAVAPGASLRRVASNGAVRAL